MVDRTIPLEFENASGEKLAARLELPADEPVAYALFAHCFTCSKDIAAAGRIGRGLRQRGIAVLRFDFTGLGASEGDFANTNFSSNLDDLVAAANYLREHHQPPTLLVGHSLGGAAVLMAAPRIPEAKAVATIAAPSTPEDLRRMLKDDLATIENEGVAKVELGGREFTIKKQFLDDLSSHDLLANLADREHALLVFHGTNDKIVPTDHARKIFDAAAQPKSFVALQDADHLLTNPADSAYVADVLAAWAGRYVGREQEADEAPPEGRVLVEEAGRRLTQLVKSGRHRLWADEPAHVGGDDKGPSPYDYLLSGLGACTTMTLRMYANHKQWPLEHARVTLKHQKVHAKDCEQCETEKGKVDVIEREIEIVGDQLTAEQRARILEIADRCPVHRTLTSEIHINTNEKGPA